MTSLFQADLSSFMHLSLLKSLLPAVIMVLINTFSYRLFGYSTSKSEMIWCLLYFLCFFLISYHFVVLAGEAAVAPGRHLEAAIERHARSSPRWRLPTDPNKQLDIPEKMRAVWANRSGLVATCRWLSYLRHSIFMGCCRLEHDMIYLSLQEGFSISAPRPFSRQLGEASDNLTLLQPHAHPPPSFSECHSVWVK